MEDGGEEGSSTNPSSSHYSSQNLLPKSSPSFLNPDFSFQPSHDSFLIAPNPNPNPNPHHCPPLPPPHPRSYHPSLHAPYALISWPDAPTHIPRLPPPPRPFISFAGCPGVDHISHEEARKKMHREVERQRRQGMNSLFCSLRSLLPLGSVKGKRSASDHMNEAFNYIQDLRGQIKGLEVKRDKLRRKSPFVALQMDSSGSGATPVNCFCVHPYLDGIEVVIRGEFNEQEFPLSRVLLLLAQEGVQVVNCMYTRNNDIAIYTIKSEACVGGSFDIAGLQWKLGQLLNS
ncbi:hypothetical protein MLD38_025643 [Melastoma candidum]|uniref:Uncharacterized protein n=1 Tax=Melastoma candidum TaxID=119954 RepID=A0ACB9NW20_9MYRT|nr:hypothetical protein MLD38_025643 [Melastoma candidum]